MKYIINADDLGGYKNVNEPIINLLKDGTISQSTIMVTVHEYYLEAKELVFKNNLQGNIGVHLSLTRGRPLTDPIKKTPFFNEQGFLYGKYLQKKIHYFYIKRKIRDAIEIELDAQMKKYLKDGYTLMHFDSHGNIHVYPSLYKTFIKVGKRNNFLSARLPYNIHTKNPILNLLKIKIIKKIRNNFKTTNLLTFSIKEALNTKPKDSFELMTHPGSNEINEIDNIKIIRNNLGIPTNFKNL